MSFSSRHFFRTTLPFVFGCVGVTGFSVIHPLPGTGALRTLFLLLCAIYALVRWRMFPSSTFNQDKRGKGLIVFLVVLTLWMGGRSVYLTHEGEPYLGLFLREWLKFLAVGWLAAIMAIKAPRHEARGLFYALFVGLFIHVIATLAHIPWGFHTQNRLVLTLSLLGNYGYVSPLVDCVLAILMADIAQRLIHNERLLPLGVRWLAVLLLLTLAASILLAAKSSALVTVLITVFFVLVMICHPSRYRKVAILAAFTLLSLAAAASFKVENRWKNVSESIQYAFDVDSNRDWLNSGYTQSRPDIDGSFYLRAAWLNIALQGIKQNPLGLGYSSDAFGRYVQSRFNLPNYISSHSGWADFTLANGIPSLVLLLGAGACLVRRSWQAFGQADRLSGLSLAFLTLCFYFRGLLDGHFSASRITGFVLMAGLLWGLLRRTDACKSEPN